MAFQSTRPVWGATKVGTVYKTTGKVSIHAPRVGRDLGGDKAASLALFQSTRPVWGATCPFFVLTRYHKCFNPRAPCGARLRFSNQSASGIEFQSTRPVWGATKICYIKTKHYCVSIHAPRVGRDAVRVRGRDFWLVSIHAPRVGRDLFVPCLYLLIEIVSIHAPRVGRDHQIGLFVPYLLVSIHAPRVGRD